MKMNDNNPDRKVQVIARVRATGKAKTMTFADTTPEEVMAILIAAAKSDTPCRASSRAHLAPPGH